MHKENRDLIAVEWISQQNVGVVNKTTDEFIFVGTYGSFVNNFISEPIFIKQLLDEKQDFVITSLEQEEVDRIMQEMEFKNSLDPNSYCKKYGEK